MATHASDITSPGDERTEFRGGAKLIVVGAIVAIGGIGAAANLGSAGRFPYRSFLFAYLAAYVFVLALALGSLAFVLLQHLTRAAWSVGVRRTAENFAATLPVLAVLALPLIISVGSLNGYLYRWALPMSRASDQAIKAFDKGQMEIEEPATNVKSEHAPVADEDRDFAEEVAAPTDPSNLQLDPLDLSKRNTGLHWLNPWFFIFRVIFYLVAWSAIALWYRRTSITQDQSGDESLTLKMQIYSAPCLVLLGLTITAASFDLLMSLDPHWYSTMFGVYYIANAFVGSYALLIITIYLLQVAGYMRHTITVEHYHDLGKYLFAFTFFYGYIAFGQYILMWYANIPEETEWMARHGVSTVVHSGWNYVILAILFGHILIPFAGLLSRHVKRIRPLLVFWALWQLVFVAVDMYWLVLPEMGQGVPGSGWHGPETATIVMDIAAIVGLLGAFFGAFGFLASKAALRPTHDPRLADSLVFQNI